MEDKNNDEIVPSEESLTQEETDIKPAEPALVEEEPFEVQEDASQEEPFAAEVVNDEPRAFPKSKPPKPGFKLKKWHLIVGTLVLILVIIFTVLVISPAGWFHYSHGYRLGLVPKFSHKGLIVKTYEGELYYGNESDHGKHGAVTNPWLFTVVNKDLVPSVEGFVGEYAVVEYDQYRFRNPLKARTKYQVLSIEKPTGEFSIDGCRKIMERKGFSKGQRFGRIAKLSLRHRGGFIGAVTKTWEGILQIGNEGNDFVEMSFEINVADCGTEALKSGKTFDISYLEKNFKWFSRTKYRVYALTPKEASTLQ